MKQYLQILIIFTTLLVSSCTNDDYDDPDPKKPFKREWYQIVKTDTLTSQKMNKELMDLTLPLGSTIIRNSFLYHSINGTDTLTLSGAVCWPIGIQSCSEIWLESHYFCTCWDECPSQKTQPAMLISSNKSAIYIGADYQGLGLSKDLDAPYLNTVLLASQNIECFKAAMTIIKDFGPDMADDYHTYNVGYSLGGAVAMGIAREVELDPELNEIIHLKKTLCGGGPYDQVAYFNHHLEDIGMQLDFPIAFLCAIRSIISSNPSFREKYDYSDCYTEKLINSGIFEVLDSKNYGTGAINDFLEKAGCSTLKEIVSAELLDRDSRIFKDLLKELQKLDLVTGWTPRNPILIRHSKTDTYVTYACMESAMNSFSGNPNVTFDPIKSGKHSEDGVQFYLKIFFDLYPLD